jgi:hypothetical protein
MSSIKDGCSSDMLMSACRVVQCYGLDGHRINLHCPENLNQNIPVFQRDLL